MFKAIAAFWLAMSLTLNPAAAQVAQEPEWVQAFAISPASYQGIRLPPEIVTQFDALPPVEGTVRLRMAVTATGGAVRVRLSNELGQKQVTIGGASIGRAGKGLDALPGTMHRLTFNGGAAVSIPAGAPVLSDPIGFHVRALDELVVSVFVKEPVKVQPLGGVSMGLAPGNAVMDLMLATQKMIVSRPVVSGVLVSAKRSAGVIVALGDSISDPARQDPEKPHGWVATLAQRLQDNASTRHLSAISAGISGNRVVSDGWGPSALARADRDVFSVPGLTHVILLEGINDIGMTGPSPLGDDPALDVEALIDGYAQLAARAHAIGVKIFIGTLLPFRGANYFSEAKEAQRLEVNRWIRHSRLFDGIIDFDAAMRDPAAPDKLNPKFDPGDHLHPNDAGYRAMGEAIDLRLFK